MLYISSNVHLEEIVIEFKPLLELQKFDLKIDDQDEKIQKVLSKPKKLAKDIEKEEELVKSKEALLKKIIVRQRSAETELEAINSKISTNESRLKSAGLNPDTYVALEKELAGARPQVLELEEKIIEDMEKVEVLKNDVEKSRKVLAGRKIQLEECANRTQGEEIDLKKERELLLTQRRQASIKIQVNLLEIYEELRRTVKGRVIWEADRPFCPACGMGFPAGFLNSLIGSDLAENCPNCQLLIRWTGVVDV